MDDVLNACGVAGVHTLKQFKYCGPEDIVWPEGTLGGKKMFLKMAIAALKPTAPTARASASCDEEARGSSG